MSQAIQDSVLKLGNTSIHFLTNVVDSANIGIETGNTAAKKIGDVSINGSTEIAKQSFILGNESLVLSGELSKKAFKGTTEIAKIAFSGTGRIAIIAFNGSSELLGNIFGAINFTAQAMGSQIKNQLDLRKSIDDYMAIHGYSSSIQGKIKGHFNNSVNLIRHIIIGVFSDLRKQLEFKLKKLVFQLNCEPKLFRNVKCPDQNFYEHIKIKINNFKDSLITKKTQLLKKIDTDTIICLYRINSLNDKSKVPELLNGLNREIEQMFDINELYKGYNTMIDELNREIDQKLKEQKSNNTVVNPNNIQTVVLPENSDNNSVGVNTGNDNPEPVNPEPVNPEVVNTVGVNTEPVNTGNVNTENSNPGPVNPAGGRKSRRNKHRKSKAKKTVGKRMKTHRRIRRR